MMENAILAAYTSTETEPEDTASPSLEERLLAAVSTTLGLRLIPGTGEPFYLKNRGKERYLFRDDHAHWYILQPSAKASEEAYVRWVFLPEDKPTYLARTGLEHHTVVGYDYVRRFEAPDPVETTVTAKELTVRWGETTYECGGCGEDFDESLDHALHCWEEHPWIPTPGQIRLERER
ncbi:hypothetical protein SAMN04487946_11128 [Halobellus clavatus]|uniref:C2H2-type domain-containing protein n=2 Tax=Halobellus clavatus TaxID=660517 RepID=A0A1H3IVZ9_9EURY|nr:hypothetical protein SAMN04487946_11128 [Halobellus clavatus]